MVGQVVDLSILILIMFADRHA
ncbi:hypothetical protein MHPYR_60102 [uncultured Mycobacterium sp.]|uniref:Uncharacterized protein n=1 Tax=uncultured Mycobacterium sp. TaxID=171292 RepID=A0A1Y5PIX4_9MYCO|nr:hypothetical protein MHPYR_60102 [uncultured Mycobacterium sp.]